MESKESEALLRGQKEIWQHMLGFADTIALRSAVELRIADIIHSHDTPVTLSQIVSHIPNASRPDTSCLARIMRLLVHKNIFTSDHPSEGEATLYGPTPASRWLLHDVDLSMVDLIEMNMHPQLMASWYCFSQCVKEGGIAFKKAYGCEIWEYASKYPEFSKLFNHGTASLTRIATRAIMIGYKDGFGCIGSLVDMGGGIGVLVAEIVKSYPHIKGINFDLPHVIATAPSYDGVCHVQGDMFQEIPKADAIFLKSILHDWNDEDCIKILRNCRQAIPPKTGKIVIIDAVIQPDNDVGVALDLFMMAYSSGGRERTELQWKKILEEGGFPRYNIIKIPALPFSVLEAYPAADMEP